MKVKILAKQALLRRKSWKNPIGSYVVLFAEKSKNVESILTITDFFDSLRRHEIVPPFPKKSAARNAIYGTQKCALYLSVPLKKTPSAK